MGDKFRMVEWLVIAAVFYVLALEVFSGEQPQLQTLFWKLGNVTVASFLGYLIDRRAFPYARVAVDSPPLWFIRRAIIMAATMLTIGLGL
jgi:hypothetical protein